MAAPKMNDSKWRTLSVQLSLGLPRRLVLRSIPAARGFASFADASRLPDIDR